MVSTAIPLQRSTRIGSIGQLDGRKVKIVQINNSKVIEDDFIRQIGYELEGYRRRARDCDFYIDFGDVDFLSSAGLGKLITFDKQCKQHGQITLRLFGIRPEIYDVFAITKLNRLFSITDNVPYGYREEFLPFDRLVDLARSARPGNDMHGVLSRLAHKFYVRDKVSDTRSNWDVASSCFCNWAVSADLGHATYNTEAEFVETLRQYARRSSDWFTGQDRFAEDLFLVS